MNIFGQGSGTLNNHECRHHVTVSETSFVKVLGYCTELKAFHPLINNEFADIMEL